MATPDWSFVSQENLNFSRLSKLLVDGGTKVLREVFDSINLPTLLKKHLVDPKNHAILQKLKSKHILKPEQWERLYPKGGSTVDSKSFDITLLSLLLRSICNLPTPTGGWDNPPAPTSTNKEDDVVRIRLFRNQVYGHITEAAIADSEFTKCWDDMASVLVRLGGVDYQQDIDKLKVVSMDPEDLKYYTQCLKEWATGEDRIIKKVDEATHELTEKMDEATHEIKEKIEEMHQLKERMPKFLTKKDVELCSKNLKSSTKRQTEFQPKLMASHSFTSARTDDIFTNLTIQRGRKPLKEHLGSNQMMSNPIKTCREIFIRSEEDTSSAKSILVIGKPGIGKTLFCQKLVRDWANDELFPNESNTTSVGFDFVYLLTFRQLNLLEDEKLNLRELLNHSPFLDERSNIDESLFEYIIEHPKKVLFILDGYDEYARRSNIEGNGLEEKYANNPRHRMPVGALVSKLIKKKVFTDATVMVTSRPQEADGLGSIQFDALAEVAGFSPEQVKEFIGKYFQSKPKITNRVLEHIVNNESLLSTAHIPMLSFLMCWCLEWQIESNVENDLPNTITELYSQVVRIFEMKHHSKSKYRTTEIPQHYQVPPVVEDTLDKLSKLAAETMLNKKFIFEEADLQKFSISSEEAEVLKASGLLTCGTGIRKTPFMITRDYCFSHLTLHEYFAACQFVKNNELPPTTMVRYESSLVPQFMSGLLGRERNENTMEQLLQAVMLQNDVVLPAKYLYEYQEEEFGVRMIKKYYHCYRSEREGYLDCGLIADVDCAAVSYFLNLLSQFNRETKAQQCKTSSPEPFLINGLMCSFNTAAGAKRICDSLKTDQFCPITSLRCHNINDECLKCLIEALPSTNITNLRLYYPNITDAGLERFCEALASAKITNLHLDFIDISDVGLQRLCQEIQSTQLATFDIRLRNIDDKRLQYLSKVLPIITMTKLDLVATNNTDGGLQDLSQALPSSNITTLNVGFNSNITDVGLQYLSDALPLTNITAVNFFGNMFTDAGLQYLSERLPSTKITILNIDKNGFTDVGLQHLSDVLPSTGITTLTLDGNKVTDVGLQYLSGTLPSTRLSTLNLRDNEYMTDKGLLYLCEKLILTNISTLDLCDNHGVTDVGLQHLSKALPSTKITALLLRSYNITDKGLHYLSKSLPSTNITTLELECGIITDEGFLHLSEAITLAKLTTLKLGSRCITASGLEHLSKALLSSTITKLDLSGIRGINDINLGFLYELLPSMKIIIQKGGW